MSIDPGRVQEALKYLHDPETGLPYDSTTFDWRYWMYAYGGQPALPPISETYTIEERIRDFDIMLALDDEGKPLPDSADARKLLTRSDPLLFALIYFTDALSEEIGYVSFGDNHLDMYREVRLWEWQHSQLVKVLKKDTPRRNCCIVAPRNSGKSHTMLKMAPLWAACHGHVKFIAAASDTGDAAAEQFGWWISKKDGQLRYNQLLMNDFPEMTHWTDVGASIMFDNGLSIKSQSISSPWRGSISGNTRPDLVLLDDIDVKKMGSLDDRVDVITGALQWLGKGRIYLMGTTTTWGNITHSLLMKTFGEDDMAPEWAWRWRVLYQKPIIELPDGTERSFWEDRWPYNEEGNEDSLCVLRANDSKFSNEFENRPGQALGAVFTRELFLKCRRETFRPDFRALVVDPVASISNRSDYAAICVAGYDRQRVVQRGAEAVGILFTDQRKVYGFDLRDWMQDILDEWDRNGQPISKVVIEVTGTGGRNYDDILKGLTITPELTTPSTQYSKEDRIERAAEQYLAGRVVHVGYQKAEEQMLSWAGKDSIPHDDLINVVGDATLWALDPKLVGRQPKKRLRPAGSVSRRR